MLATNGPRWFDRTTPDPRWPSFGVSLIITAAMFAAALAAMRTIAPWRSDTSAPDKPVVVRLTPPTPAPVPKAKPVQTVQQVPRSAVVAAPTTIPTTIAPIATPGRIDVPLVAPVVPSVAAPARTSADSGVGARGTAGAASASTGDRVFAGGAPIARSGMVLPPKVLDTPAARDSIMKVRMAAIVEMAKKPPTGEIKAEMDARARQADRVARRATTVGNANDVHVPMGKGVDGVGVDGGPGNGVKMTPNGPMVSIPFPLFYPGPSPAQRKRDSIVNADNVARLGRLGVRVKTKADSVRADSLRADSIAKARRRIIP
ncbi:MAG TPA: hypothetical protein VN706_01425 [Gemmatimonadaceae bacterium]|nr:hypothetical protein [Gemmatimonadaceae bacterium]